MQNQTQFKIKNTLHRQILIKFGCNRVVFQDEALVDPVNKGEAGTCHGVKDWHSS